MEQKEKKNCIVKKKKLFCKAESVLQEKSVVGLELYCNTVIVLQLGSAGWQG